MKTFYLFYLTVTNIAIISQLKTKSYEQLKKD